MNVGDARRHVNFSGWDSYRPDEQVEFFTQAGSAARTGQMPLPRYTLLHRQAVLTPRQRLIVSEWSGAERKRLRAAPGTASPSGNGNAGACYKRSKSPVSKL